MLEELEDRYFGWHRMGETRCAERGIQSLSQLLAKKVDVLPLLGAQEDDVASGQLEVLWMRRIPKNQPLDDGLQGRSGALSTIASIEQRQQGQVVLLDELQQKLLLAGAMAVKRAGGQFQVPGQLAQTDLGEAALGKEFESLGAIAGEARPGRG